MAMHAPLFPRFLCLGAIGLSTLLGFSLTHAQAKDDGSNEIPVGEYASLTGDKATFGIGSSNAAQLAADEVNAAGGILNGKKIRIILEDDQSKAGQPATIVRKLISNDQVVAIIGEIASSLSLEAAPICQGARVPMISPASTNPAVTEKGDYIFRVCFIDPFQGIVMAKFALDYLKINRVSILTAINQDYSVGLAYYFREYFTKHGGKIVNERSYSSGDKDFRAQLTSIRASAPQAIFVPGYYTEGGLIARQAKSLGIQVPLLGGDGWDSPTLLKIAGAAMDGSYFSTHFSPNEPSPRVQNFVKNYRAQYHRTPDAMAALGYDAMGILMDAIQRAGTPKGPRLRDAIANTKDYQGVTGKITLNSKRNAIKSAVILQIKDRQFHYVTTIKD